MPSPATAMGGMAPERWRTRLMQVPSDDLSQSGCIEAFSAMGLLGGPFGNAFLRKRCQAAEGQPGERLGAGILAARGTIRRSGLRSGPSAAVRTALDHAERRNHRPDGAVQLSLCHRQTGAPRPWIARAGRDTPN